MLIQNKIKALREIIIEKNAFFTTTLKQHRNNDLQQVNCRIKSITHTSDFFY